MMSRPLLLLDDAQHPAVRLISTDRSAGKSTERVIHMDRQIVKVYVRAGDHEGERTLSFRPPKEVPQSEWLKRGFAIDGNSVIASVTAATQVGYQTNESDEEMARIFPIGARLAAIGNPQRGVLSVAHQTEAEPTKGTLIMVLREVEAWLVDWLGTLGYDVEFA
jgi:hypothetical protein